MPDELQTKPDTEQIEQKKPEVLQPGVKRILWGGGGILVLLLIFTFALPAGRILFFTGSLLSLVTLVVIAMQSLIYSGQWKAMAEGLAIERAKTDPRLRVAKVRMENFQVGLSPIFITTVANDGFIDATGVELHIGVKFGHDREFKWINPQIVTIPARGQESYPIVSGAFFSEGDLREFNSNSAPIEVSVGLKYWPGSPTEPRRFCYRYLPWHGGERPDDIPQFVPCDFNPGINITLKIPSALLKHTAGINVLRQQVKRAETKGESEGEQENPN